jgi:two-component system response regulator MprA
MTAAHNNRKSILVVDDEPAIVRMVVAIIEDLGFAETYTAPDAETALEVFEARHPTLVLTDVKLPGMDGVELARRIKSDGTRTPVLLMSAHGEPVSHPGDGFLAKPFDLDQFAGFVNRYVRPERGSKRGGAGRTPRR